MFSDTDGYAAGDLKGFSVSTDGVVNASFDNGVNLDLYRVGLANSNDPGSHFKRIGYSLYQADTESAALITSDRPGIAGLGKILGSSLETSNVDIAGQFGDLIFTQRAFQANSKSMVAADEMLKTLIGLKR
jgi:flagellar hook protein FlgE